MPAPVARGRTHLPLPYYLPSTPPTLFFSLKTNWIQKICASITLDCFWIIWIAFHYKKVRPFSANFSRCLPCLYSPPTFKLLTIHLLHHLLLLQNVFATENTVGDSLILHCFAENNKSWMHCMQVIIVMHLLKKCAFNSCIISNSVFVPPSQYFHSFQRRPRQHGICRATWYPSEDQKDSNQAKKGSKWNWCKKKPPCPFLICCCLRQHSFFACGSHPPESTIKFETQGLESWSCG